MFLVVIVSDGENMPVRPRVEFHAVRDYHPGGRDVAEEPIIYHHYSQAVGWLEIEASAEGIRSLSYVTPPAEPQTRPQGRHLKKLARELDQYFDGTPVRFSVPLDTTGATEFRRSVWTELTRIPYGRTKSYADVAAAVGNPRAARAVGTANKCNPIPILVPCHRVICSDGSPGGYNSGLGIKRSLLELEGAPPLRW